jgi:hypothetical protein
MEKESLTPSESFSAPAHGSTLEKAPTVRASEASHAHGHVETAAAGPDRVQDQEVEFLQGPKLVSVIVSLCLVGESTHPTSMDS